MNGYIVDLEKITLANTYFRHVLHTNHYSQLVLMCLKQGEEIGEEVHGLDQFIRVEAGEGKAILDGKEHPLHNGTAVMVPAGARHNIINISKSEALKLYTVYSPPDHKDGQIAATKADAEHDQPYDGLVSPQ